MFSCTQFIKKCVLNQLLTYVPGLPNLLVPHTNLTNNYSQVSSYLTRKALARTLTYLFPKSGHPQRSQAYISCRFISRISSSFSPTEASLQLLPTKHDPKAAGM